MKIRILAFIVSLLPCLAVLAQEEDVALKLWMAGKTVNSEAVEQYGIARCFVAMEIPDDKWRHMQGLTYKDNPYIGRKDLRYLKLLHWDYDQQIHIGEMICNAAIAHELVDIFHQLYQAHYPIQRMVLPDNYGADDEQQMRANNTSCFCYRAISGTTRLSKHAKGLAVDLNPLHNPYVIPHKGGRTEIQPKTAAEYANRDKSFHYKIDCNDLAYRLFSAYGYEWGGAWKSRKDYQHFEKDEARITKRVTTGDERTELYLPLVKGKRVALFSNQTGLVGEEHQHVLDLLTTKGVKITAVFSPEHGFRGRADAGAAVGDEVDKQTGVPILSLYGQNRKKHLGEESMKLFDVLLIDIQDVGLRYYTYYVTMCHLMDACTKYGREVIILDRPNPNGHYVDGPILNMELRSGVGHLPIPVVHGMTLGELARMAVGEKWLNEGNKCRLTVIPCQNYTHQTHYSLPIAPSPNLPNMQSIYLYPSLCPFEGTVVSMGRGTDKPFLQYGHPQMYVCHSYSFTPMSMPGATHPTLQGQKCYGKDLSNLPYETIWQQRMNLTYVIDAYRCLREAGKADGFFTSFFDKLLGQTYVREMIEDGCSEAEIRARWKDEVENFKQKRKKYLLYE